MKNGIYIETVGIEFENYGKMTKRTYDNCKVYYKNNEIYFVEHSDNSKNWIKNKRLHREGGPAVIWANGTKYWFLDGKQIDVDSQEEFIRYLNTIAFR